MFKKIISLVLTGAILLSFASCSDKDSEEPNNFEGETNTGEVKLESGEKYAVMTIHGFGEITFKLYPKSAPLAVENFIKNAENGYFEDKDFHRIIQNFMIQGGSYDGSGISDPSKKSYKIETNPNLRHFYGALCVATNALGQNGDQFYIVSKKDKNTFNAEINSLEEYISNLDLIKAELESLKEIRKDPEAAGFDSETVEYYIAKYEYDIQHFTDKIDMIHNVTEEVKNKYSEVGGVANLDGGYTVMGQAIDGFDVIDAIEAVEVTGENQSTPVEPVLIQKVEIKTY